MRISFLLLVLTLLTSKPRAQEKTMLPEQERLSVFIGSWTVDGSETTYLEVCNRIQGNHIECKAAGNENGKQLLQLLQIHHNWPGMYHQRL